MSISWLLYMLATFLMQDIHSYASNVPQLYKSKMWYSGWKISTVFSSMLLCRFLFNKKCFKYNKIVSDKIQSRTEDSFDEWVPFKREVTRISCSIKHSCEYDSFTSLISSQIRTNQILVPSACVLSSNITHSSDNTAVLRMFSDAYWWVRIYPAENMRIVSSSSSINCATRTAA